MHPTIHHKAFTWLNHVAKLFDFISSIIIRILKRTYLP